MSDNANDAVDMGCVGFVVAFILSWIANKSIAWSIVHGLCAWYYVIYWILFRSKLYDWLCSIAV